MKQKRKLIFVDFSEVLGGAQIFLSDLMSNLSEYNKISIIKNQNSRVFIKKNLLKVKIYEIYSATITFFSIWNIIKQLQSIKPILKNEQYIIVSNTNRSHFIILLYKIFYNRKLIIFFLLHDFLFPKKLLLISKSIKNINYIPISECLASHYVLKDNAIIQNGFNFLNIKLRLTKSQLSEKYNLNESSNWILGVGALVRWKGVEYFIKAAKELDNDNPPTDFIWIGKKVDTPLDYSNEIYSSIKKINLKNVFIIEPNSDIYDFIYHSEVYISSSLNQFGGPESFGRVLIEAMFLQTPVIATNAGGPSEFITNNKDGLLVNPNSSLELIKSIQFYRNNIDRIPKFQSSGYSTALKYDINNSARKLMQLIGDTN